jgi:hypothetical protein
MTFAQIGEREGISAARAFCLYRRGLIKLQKAVAHDLVRIERGEYIPCLSTVLLLSDYSQQLAFCGQSGTIFRLIRKAQKTFHGSKSHGKSGSRMTPKKDGTTKDLPATAINAGSLAAD